MLEPQDPSGGLYKPCRLQTIDCSYISKSVVLVVRLTGSACSVFQTPAVLSSRLAVR